MSATGRLSADLGADLGADLDTVLDRAAAVAERAAAATRAEPVDPLVRRALAEAAGASAREAERAVGERAVDGTVGWDQVWRDPAALGPEGVRLVQRALVVAARDMRGATPRRPRGAVWDAGP